MNALERLGERRLKKTDCGNLLAFQCFNPLSKDSGKENYKRIQQQNK